MMTVNANVAHASRSMACQSHHFGFSVTFARCGFVPHVNNFPVSRSQPLTVATNVQNDYYFVACHVSATFFLYCLILVGDTIIDAS